MLFRFSLYGFLKNQRYFEPFLILVLLEKGLTFFEIGLLIAFREITVIALEVPSGAIADVYGRRKSMMLSFGAYLGSFLIFAVAEPLVLLLPAMLLFGVGEAFRTGTHKAMIFTWLRLQGRPDERTRYYGYTRSWSKLGSAFSVVLAGVFVFTSDSYVTIFYFAMVPCLFNIVNFLGYPPELDEVSVPGSPAAVIRHLSSAVGTTLRARPLRRLLLESMGFEGTFHAVKDYIQPVLLVAAVSATTGLLNLSGLSDAQRASLLVAPVYLLLYLLSATASRHAHRFVDSAGSEDRAAFLIWGMALLVFGVMSVSAYLEILWFVIATFVLLHVLQNFWRPVLISRFDTGGDETQGATLLSVESQGRRLATMGIAPLLGLGVDYVRAAGPGGEFWPVGALGAALALGFFVTSSLRMRHISDRRVACELSEL